MFFPSVELEVFCDFNIFTFLDIDSYCFRYGPKGISDIFVPKKGFRLCDYRCIL